MNYLLIPAEDVKPIRIAKGMAKAFSTFIDW